MKYFILPILFITIVTLKYYFFYISTWKDSYHLPQTTKDNIYEYNQSKLPYYSLYRISKEFSPEEIVYYLTKNSSADGSPYVNPIKLESLYFYYPKEIVVIDNYKDLLSYKRAYSFVISDIDLFKDSIKDLGARIYLSKFQLMRINKEAEDFFVYQIVK
jgi:hypothetical protein